MKHSRRKEPTRGRQKAGWRWSRRRAVWLILVLGVCAMALFGRTSYSLWAKRMALERMQIGAISEAHRYLVRAAWGDPDDGTIDMMLAFCYRQSRQVGRWREALQAAAEKGVSPALIEREVQLYRIHAGHWREGAESQLGACAREGITTYDVPAAFVSGCLANGRSGLARQLLDGWNADSPNDAHVSYLTGKYWETLGDTEQARTQYKAALAITPRHELAHVALAEMFEQSDQLDRAFRQYSALGSVSPANEVAALGAARTLRKMVQLDRAHAILEPFAQTTDLTAGVAVEMGRIAMDRGDFADAERWFERAGVDRTQDPRVLKSVLRLLGMQGKAPEAERVFSRMAAVGSRVTRTYDLRVRLALDPGDTAAAAEMKRLFERLDIALTPPKTEPAELATDDENTSPGYRLFVSHCSACHGPKGDGNGLGSRHLFPPPRDLRRERGRLVSTKNGVPTLDDTVTVLRRGIPGTSMPAYDDLDEKQLRVLAEEVHRMRREGLREGLVNLLESEGDEVDEHDVEDSIDRLVSPGESIVVPSLGPAEPSSIVRGKDTFVALGCASCHGEDGSGVAEQVWHDERGSPVRTRDLAREPLKGGQDAKSIYRRIAAGMPGSPHPSSRGVDQQQLIDVVHFCLSLSREPKKVLTDHQRAALATGRAYLASLGPKPPQ